MNNKRVISIIAIIMAALMLFGLFASVLPLRARAVSQEEIDQLKRQKEEISERVREAQERIDALKDEKSSVLEEKAALEEKNRAAEESLELVRQELAMYDRIIAEKAEEVDAAKALESAQLARYRSRVRAIEENGGYNVLALLLHCRSFSELLASLDDTNRIMESDKALELAYRAAREETERVKAEYEAVRADCEGKQDELRAEQESIYQEMEEVNKRLVELADDIAKALEEYEAERQAETDAGNQLTELIRRYEEEKRAEEQRRREEEARRREQEQQTNPQDGGTDPGSEGDNGASDPGNGDSGSNESGNGGSQSGLNPGSASSTASFTWPVPCSSRVTSRFGSRIDPISGEISGHAGIDIDGYGHDGEPIIAAAAGTVIVASNGSGGYGNYVTIDHGNGYCTVYAHMSGLAVGYGQSVSAGTTVGYLGSTGKSTGTHCHFEIRENGTPIDPEAFFTGLSHWNC